MMIALLALLLISAIGLAFMLLADTENSINNNYRDSQKAYFASRAGLENVRLLLSPTGSLNGPALNMDGSMPFSGSNAGVIYVKNPNATESVAAIDPSTGKGNTITANRYLDDELCHEQFVGLGLNQDNGVACNNAPISGNSPQLMTTTGYFQAPAMGTTDIPNTGGAGALGFKWVRITNKQNYMGLMNQKVDSTQSNGAQVCFNGTSEVAISVGKCSDASFMPVWVLTSLAVTPGFGNNPGSRRLTQMEVALSPPLVIPAPNAPVSTQAPITLQGNLQVNGYDNCTCTSTLANRPGKTCDKTRDAVDSANTITVQGSAGKGITSGSSTPLHSSVNPWPYDINKIISQYSSAAQPATGPPWNMTCTGTPNLAAVPAVYAQCSSPTQPLGRFPDGMPDNPTNSQPAVVHIPGSVDLGGATGSGVLIVDGDLTVHGGLSYYGLIIVRGQITFLGGGSQPVNLYGAILAGQDVNAQGIVGDSIGGSFSFQYDSCALKQKPIFAAGPPQLLAEHEIMY
jgi:hypothetical protein